MIRYIVILILLFLYCYSYIVILILLFIVIFADVKFVYAGVFTQAAKETGISFKVLKSVSYVESGFHPYALDINGTSNFPKTYASAYYIAKYFCFNPCFDGIISQIKK